MLTHVQLAKPTNVRCRLDEAGQRWCPPAWQAV